MSLRVPVSIVRRAGLLFSAVFGLAASASASAQANITSVTLPKPSIALVADTNSGAVYSLNNDLSVSTIDGSTDKITTTCPAPAGLSLATSGTSTNVSAVMNAVAPDSPHQALYILGQDTGTSDGGVVGLATSSCAAASVTDLMNGADNNALLAVDSTHHLVYALSDTGSSTGTVTLTVIDTSNFPTLTSTNYTLANTPGPFNGMVVDPSTGKLAIYGEGLYVYDPSAKAVSQVYSNAFMTIANAFIVPTSSTSTTTRLAIIPSAQTIGGSVIIELIDLSKVNGSFYVADNDNPVVINSNEQFASVAGGAYSAKTQLIYVQAQLSPTQQELLSYNYQTPSSPNETVVADTSKTKAAGSTQTQVVLNDKAGAVFLVTPDITYEYNNPGSQGIVVYAVPLGNTGIPVTPLDGSAMGDSGAEITTFATSNTTGKTYLGANDSNVFIITPTTSGATAINLAVTGASTGTAGVAQSFNVTLSLPANSVTTNQPSGTVTLTAVNGSTTVTLGTADASSAYSPNGATISGTFPTSGDWSVIASYPGDSNFAGTTSDALKVTVAAATVALNLNITGSATATTDVPQTYVIKLSLPSGVTTTATPTGTISVSATSGGNTISLGTVSAATAFSTYGATVTGTFAAAGTYTIGATYSGDANFTSVSGNAFTVTVTQVQTRQDTGFGISLNGTVGVVGSTTVVSVAAPAEGFAVPSGNVTVSVIAPGTTAPVQIGTVPASGAYGGVQTLNYKVTTAGTYTFEISYPGDTSFNALTSPLPSTTETVGTQPFATAVAVTGPASLDAGQQATYNVTLKQVDNISGTPVPGGTITVTASQGSNTVTLGTVQAAVVTSTGSGSVNYVFSTAGTWNIVATYSGDTATGYTGSTSSPVATVVTVTSTSPQFTVAAVDSGTTTPVTGGLIDSSSNLFPKLNGSMPDTVTVTVKSLNNWSGTLNLAAAEVPSGVTVQFANNTGAAITQIVLPAGGAVTFTAKLSNSTTSALTKPGAPWKRYGERGSAMLATCLFGLLFVPRGRRRQATKLLGLAVLLLTLATTVSGCTPAPTDINLTLTPTAPANAQAVGITFEYTKQ